MKATGIVRRIDDLGRVVIPKEIRRTMRIKEGDPLEIFVDREGEVILKKYSPISELGDFAREYADALSESLGSTVLIADRDEIIAVSGGSKKEFLNKPIGAIVEKVMDERRTLLVNNISGEVNKDYLRLIDDNAENEINAFCISPIIPRGDVIGSVIICTKDEKVVMGNLEQKLGETAAGFLAKQLEQ
ncbi:MAG: stage V sporulation protein T [Bacillota bacterium]|nr:stage V sporulation protein T [Bacillota bacterium]